MTNKTYCHLEQNSDPNWETNFNISFDLIKRQINNKLWQLNLTQSYSIEQVRSEVFIIIENLISNEKLEYQIIDDNYSFIIIKPDKSKEKIINFKAWLRTVSFNHIKQIRAKQNKHDKIINIENCYYIQDKKNPEEYVLSRELREKLGYLEDEDRRILEMRYFEELSYHQMCKVLYQEGFSKKEYSEVNLRKKKQRAEEKLRKLYLHN